MLIDEIKVYFGTKTKAQEILFLLQDTKQVVRQAFLDYEITKIMSFCQQHNIFCVESKFKIIFTDTGNYSNRGIRIPYDDPRPGYHFYYFSKDEKKAWAAALHEVYNHHQNFGRILGYPECCIQFFCQNFSSKNPNPVTTTTNPWLDLSKRKNDTVLIAHFPCHQQCPESLVLAKNNFQIIQQHDPQRAQEIRELLSLPME